MTPAHDEAEVADGLNPKEQRALLALVTSRTIEEAAEKAEVGARTLYRWLSERPAFRAAYRAELRGVMQAVVGRVQRSALRAIDALDGVLDDAQARPSERIAAASKLLDIAFRAQEAELVDRLDALERRINGSASSGRL